MSVNDRNVIKLYGRVTSYVFYNYFMQKLHRYTNTNKKENPPVISIEDVDWIDSNVLPCLISIGLILKRYYKEPIELRMIYKPTLLQYLDTAEFFLWVGESRLDIFKYDEDLIGGFVKEYNKNYKIEEFQFRPGYYQLNDNKKLILKLELLDRLKRYDIKRLFGELLEKVLENDQESYDTSVTCLAETVCNSILYSESNSYVCMQSLPGETHISISDIGIGFTGSLNNKNIDYNLMREELDRGVDKKMFRSEVFDDLFAIFMALKLSEDTGRLNLWKLKEIVTGNKGELLIHSNRIQLAFSYKRCDRCNKSVKDCMNCVINNFTTDYTVSPLRIYNDRIDGVHIEINFSRGK